MALPCAVGKLHDYVSPRHFKCNKRNQNLSMHNVRLMHTPTDRSVSTTSATSSQMSVSGSRCKRRGGSGVTSSVCTVRSFTSRRSERILPRELAKRRGACDKCEHNKEGHRRGRQQSAYLIVLGGWARHEPAELIAISQLNWKAINHRINVILHQ